MRAKRAVSYDISKELRTLTEICHSNLKNSNKCLAYLQEERNLSMETINRYELGYFPQSTSMLGNYVSTNTLQKLSIMDYSGDSEFSEFFYLIFPLLSEYKDVIGIGGRSLLKPEGREVLNLPKYKNSSFKKSEFLYGLDKSRSSIFLNKNVYIVEGYFDHIAMDSNGIKNSVAICGTAFSKNHMLKLARYTDKFTFVLDRDDGGTKSMERIYSKYCNQGIKMRFLSLPESCKDVDDYFSQGGSKSSFSEDLNRYIPNWN